jgi:chondroitin AC lyase
MASIKMASDRIIGTEMMNGDNMKGYYMADGATYIYKDGKEYLDIFPLWDWRKLPGVTAFEDNAPMPLIKSYQPRNKGTFVGAVSDEKQGMTVMELDRAGVKAHKAWVCTDDFILCLGAGIQADSNLVVTTSIEQCHKNGELLSWENARWNVVNTKQSAKGKEQRYFHNNTGYIVWGNTHEVVAETAERTGSWYDVMQMYHPEETHGEVTAIYLTHGVAPKQGTYQYLILPGMDKENVAVFNLSDIQILRNDATVQAVYSEGNTTCWVAAYQPVQLIVSMDLILNIQTPGIYMIRKNESGRYVINYADPTQQRNVAELELNHKKVRISLPEGKEKGKTTSIVG